MAGTVEVKVAGGVKLARIMMPLFGLGGLCVMSRPDPMRVVVGLAIIGFFWGVTAWVYAVWPKQLDDEGVTCGFGRRFLWSDLKDIRVIAQKRGATIVNHRFELKFNGGQARFGYNQCVNGKEIVSFLEGVTKRKLLPG